MLLKEKIHNKIYKLFRKIKIFNCQVVKIKILINVMRLRINFLKYKKLVMKITIYNKIFKKIEINDYIKYIDIYQIINYISF